MIKVKRMSDFWLWDSSGVTVVILNATEVEWLNMDMTMLVVDN